MGTWVEHEEFLSALDDTFRYGIGYIYQGKHIPTEKVIIMQSKEDEYIEVFGY